MPPKTRSNIMAVQQQRLNEIVEGIKENFKHIFELEKDSNPNIFVDKKFSNDLLGRILMWRNDTTVFVDEINKNFEQLKSNLLSERETPISIEIFKETIKAELNLARENLISEIGQQFQKIFQIEKIGYEN